MQGAWRDRPWLLKSRGIEMAKRSSKKDKAPDVLAPEGFNIDLTKRMADGWAKKEPGAIVQGRVLGVITTGKDERTGKPNRSIQVRLKKSAMAVIEDPDSEDGEMMEIKLEPGKLINVDETAALDKVSGYLDKGQAFDIWIYFKGKVPIKGTNRSYWDMDVRLKPLSAEEAAADDVPF
jgi:hypothetical protein